MFKTFATVSALTLGLSGAASASTVIFQDDFNTETLQTNATLDNWTVTTGSVDVIGPGFFDFYPGNGRYLDMNGSTAPNSEGRIETSGLGLVVGGQYTLSFDYGTNSNPGTLPATLTFGLGTTVGLFETLAINSIPSTLISISYTFTYDGSGDFLFFADTTGQPDQGGPVIDNVVLSAVPLPAGGLLLIGALGGLAALRRRKTA